MSILGIIPARYSSSRFPGKPLAMLNGKSMLQRVYEQAKKSSGLDEVVIATDDQRIADHASDFGAKSIITRADHPSGTDRCWEAFVLNNKKFDYVLNIQGDEPLLNPEQINSLTLVCDGKVEIATQMIKCNSYADLFDSGEVKIALNNENEALYFSRNVIPHLKGKNEKEWHLHHDYFRHVGMYIYRIDILEKISSLSPSSLEIAESLEQLRWLQNGYKITCIETKHDSHCVDTPEDLEKVLKMLNK